MLVVKPYSNEPPIQLDAKLLIKCHLFALQSEFKFCAHIFVPSIHHSGGS